MVRSRQESQLRGKTIFITGAARGIGRQIAGRCAAAGARVAVGDVDASAARTAAAQLPGALGFAVDVSRTESFRQFMQQAEAALGPPDVLINNAGILWVGSFDEEPESAIIRQFDVNVGGVMRGVRLAAERMRQRGSGHIITIASAASKLAPPGEASYTAGKHAVYGYLKTVNSELRGSGVAISIVMPTVVETELAAGTTSGAVPPLTPAEVAAPVVDLIRRPRFETTVPRWVGPVADVVGLLPEGPRLRLLRAMVPNQVAQADRTLRQDYEERMLNTTPSQGSETQ